MVDLEGGCALGLARFSLVLGLCVLVPTVLLVAADGDAAYLLESDNFSGLVGDPPDPAKWDVWVSDGPNRVVIENYALKAHCEGYSAYAWVMSHEHFSETNVTILVDGKVSSQNPGYIELGLWSLHPKDGYQRWCYVSVSMTGRIGVSYQRWGDGHGFHRDVSELSRDRWYSLNITTHTRWFNVTVTDRATGYPVFSSYYVSCDPIRSDNYVRLGQYLYPIFPNDPPRVAEAFYDNFRLYDLDPHVNLAPSWGELPILEATEDEPLTYDFAANVTNPDGPLDVLSIESNSTYVTSASGLSVTFLFGEGVTKATVPLVLRDGELLVATLVTFRVAPVNDPPSHCIPRQLEAREDLTLVVDLAPFVWDVDNPRSDLSLSMEDEFVSVHGLVLEALFPDGVLEHWVTLTLSDGLATVETRVQFIVVPVNDPPTIDLPDNVTILEDRLCVLDLAPYIVDTDTPLEDLLIMVRYHPCDVRGTELHFFEKHGGTAFSLQVEVWDVDLDHTARDRMTVIVLEVNDAPLVGDVPDQNPTEHVRLTLDLSPYVSDEESPDDDLALLFDADTSSGRPPQVFAVAGLNLTLLYDAWVPPHDIRFGVTDGNATTWTRVGVKVTADNDPPRITMPTVLALDEGTERWFEVEVEDEDDEVFLYFMNTSFHGLELHDNGTLRVWAAKGEVGRYPAQVSVMDMGGAKAQTTITIEVRNVNDPPDVPVILAPENGSVHETCEAVEFEATVEDPDIRFGQVVTVTWVSDLEGELARGPQREVAAFARQLDMPGSHRVEVTVSDGEFERSAWVDVVVREPRPDGPPDGWWRVCLVVAVVALVVSLFVAYRVRRKGT